MTKLEIKTEREALEEKFIAQVEQLSRWQSIFRNDAAIYAQNPTEDNKANMDVSATHVRLNYKWADEAMHRLNLHYAKYGLPLD